MSLMLVVGAVVAVPTTASAKGPKEITKTVPATVEYFTYQKDAGNNTVSCGSVAVVQWQDPTANRFVGSYWVAHFYRNGVEDTLSGTPPFDNTMRWFDQTLHATGGNNWIRLETVTGGRAIGVGCSEFRAKQEARFGSTAWVTITGQEDRTDPEACKKARKAYRKATRR